MTKTRTDKIAVFLDEYERDFPNRKKIAISVENFLEKILSNCNVEIHLIKCRCKSPESVRIKIFEKEYKDPATEMTDVLGARVITYYAEDTDKIVEILRQELDVDESNSEDKRKRLDGNKFGYKSIHLVAQPKTRWTRSNLLYPELTNQTIEIQVRSILEHTWAEIEHELQYKGGVEFSGEGSRRLHRVAGSLEILEDQFSSLKEEKNALIDEFIQQSKDDKTLDEELDTASLIGLLEIDKALYTGWRKAEKNGTPFQAKSDFKCVKALIGAGIDTPKKLRAAIKTDKTKSIIKKISRGGDEVTHLTIALVCIATSDQKVFEYFYPNHQILGLLAKKKTGKKTK